MVDSHIILYGALTLFTVCLLLLFFRRFELLLFDRGFAKSIGIPTSAFDILIAALVVLSVVVGMRSVGVVLISAMLIAPPVAARFWTDRFSYFLILSSLIGALSGLLGIVFSVKIPVWTGDPTLPLATGPMIVLSASGFAFLSLLIAPKKGLLARLTAHYRFILRCEEENFLKGVAEGKDVGASGWLKFRLKQKGWLSDGAVTEEGLALGKKLRRLHLLWEAYLIEMGQRGERVHHSAEQMEHILTPEIERDLMNRFELKECT